MPYALPKNPRPITILGAGGIVRDAHLPAYRIAGFPVHGICDLDTGRAQALAAAYGIERVYADSADAFRNAPENAVFDLATPPDAILPLLEQIREGAAVLIQKPMGRSIEEARAIRGLCRRKHLTAAVNFQLRFAPAIMEARRLIEAGAIGDVHDMEVRVAVFTPWHLWPFLESLERTEIPLHSIHYLDLIRSFLGEPAGGVGADNQTPRRAPPGVGALAYHLGLWRHAAGRRHHQPRPRLWDAPPGIVCEMGRHSGRHQNPARIAHGLPQGCRRRVRGLRARGWPAAEWKAVEIAGSWYPHAFLGIMASLMRYVEGSSKELPTHFEDAYRTMELVEAAYRSNDSGGTPIAHD